MQEPIVPEDAEPTMPEGLVELRRIELPATEASTREVGRALGRIVRRGDVIGLVGEMGSGKTCLVRGMAPGMQLDAPDEVASPTYLLVVEHMGPTPLRHADAWLPDKLAGFLADGGAEHLFSEDAVAVVEWADRLVASMPQQTLWITLTPTSGGGRRLALGCSVAVRPAWLDRLAEI
jgi:tRNA threonylcarbamoyladenosine biosynthesis protein TsaE